MNNNLQNNFYYQKILQWHEIDPDKYDGSYELVREVVKRYKTVSKPLTKEDLNLIYFSVIGTWKSTFKNKKLKVENSSLSNEAKSELNKIIDNIEQRCLNGEYENSGGKIQIGMFGTGNMTVAPRSKMAPDDIKLLIDLFIKINDTDNEEECIDLVEKCLIKEISGIGMAFISEILHCLKPNFFPILNDKTKENDYQPYRAFGIKLIKPSKITTYAQNIKLIKRFRDEHFAIRNYRIFDRVGEEKMEKNKSTDIENKNITNQEQGREDKQELNLILYGPPGTGKTYHTVEYAVKFANPKKYKEIKSTNLKDRDKHSAFVDAYNALVKEGRIAFTTFHQSYGYEEFIEGIKPDLDSKEIRYKKANGVFKEFCENAKKYLKSSVNKEPDGFDLIKPNATVWKISLDSAGRKGFEFHNKCLDDDCIRVGWDAAEDLSQVTEDGKESARRFIEDMKMGDIVLSCYSQNEIDAIGVITGEYEWHDDEPRLKRFRQVKWLKKWKENQGKYNILSINKNNPLKQTTVYKLWRISVEDIKSILTVESDEFNEDTSGHKEKEENEKNFVFIIDEINRGNVSKIFGELITLIEPTKRLGAEEEMKCTLPYSGDKFGVPKNVYILGTMNTADRSLVQLDAALRRRFAFKEMMPKPELLKSTQDSINLESLLKAINERITVRLDREHQIGHSYFMGVKSVDDLAYVFRQKIIPLLQEYFFDDYNLIKEVLNGQFVTEQPCDYDKGKKYFKIDVTEKAGDFVKIYADTTVNEKHDEENEQ